MSLISQYITKDHITKIDVAKIRDIPSYKVGAILGYSIIPILVLSILSNSTAGYDVSIYTALSPEVWVLFVFLFALSSVGIIVASYTEKKKIKFFVPLLILTTLLFISLPLVRDYFLLGRGDVLSMWGRVQNTIATGYIGRDSIYPLPIIWGGEFSILTGIEPHKTTTIIPIISYMSYALALTLFKRFTSSKFQLGLVLILAFIPLYSNDPNRFTGWVITFFYFPAAIFTYYLLMKNPRQVRYIILFFVAGIAGFGHPTNAIALFLTLFVITYVEKTDMNYVAKKIRGKWLYLLTALSVLVFEWYFSFPVVRGLIAREIEFLLFGGKTTEADVYGSLLGELSLSYLLQVAAWRFGVIAFLTFVAGAFLITHIHKYKMKDVENIFAVSTVMFGLFTILSPLSNFMIASQLFRLDRFNVFFSVLVIVLAGGKVLRSAINKRTVLVVLVSLLVITSALGTFTTYRSPGDKQPGREVTVQEVRAMEWTIFKYGKDDRPIDGAGLSASRFHQAISGEETNEYPDDDSPPFHFGYHKYSSVSDSYNSPHYIMISGYTRDYYPSIFPNKESYWKFSYKDTEKLEMDSGANKFYDSQEVTIYVTN